MPSREGGFKRGFSAGPWKRLTGTTHVGRPCAPDFYISKLTRRPLASGIDQQRRMNEMGQDTVPKEKPKGVKDAGRTQKQDNRGVSRKPVSKGRRR